METYVGIIRTPQDAITLFEACRLGMLPRVCRRLSEKERQNIKSGSVFVWDEREAGMRRWTDGKSWSASRVSGSFLTYREMEGKRSGTNSSLNAPSRSGRTPDAASRNSDEGDQTNNDESQDGYRYKPDGLLKQSFSITTSTGQHLHLISYFSRHPPAQTQLKQPTNDPLLRQVKAQPGMYPESAAAEPHNMPAVTRSPMSTGPLHQQPTGPGYANRQYFMRPAAGHPVQYGGVPPSYTLTQYSAPPQVAVNGTYGHPNGPQLPQPPQPSSHAMQPGYYPAQLSSAPPIRSDGPPMGYYPNQHPPGPIGRGDSSSSPYSYRPGELPPVPGFNQSPALAPPRTATPPSESHRAPHHRTGSAGSYQQGYYPSPRSAYNALTPQASISSHPSQNNSPSSTPPASSLDPRSMIAPSPLSQHSPRTLHPEYTPGSSRRSISPRRTPPTSYPPQHTQLPQIHPPTSAPSIPSASTIPSIGALVNGADTYSRDRSRSNSRSPGGGRHHPLDEGQSPAPQWSREVMNFGEDRRALNVLNKAFRT